MRVPAKKSGGRLKKKRSRLFYPCARIPQSLHDLLEMIAVLRGETKDDTTIHALRIGTKKLKRQVGIKTLQ